MKKIIYLLVLMGIMSGCATTNVTVDKTKYWNFDENKKRILFSLLDRKGLDTRLEKDLLEKAKSLLTDAGYIVHLDEIGKIKNIDEYVKKENINYHFIFNVRPDDTSTIWERDAFSRSMPSTAHIYKTSMIVIDPSINKQIWIADTKTDSLITWVFLDLERQSYFSAIKHIIAKFISERNNKKTDDSK